MTSSGHLTPGAVTPASVRSNHHKPGYPETWLALSLALAYAAIPAPAAAQDAGRAATAIIVSERYYQGRELEAGRTATRSAGGVAADLGVALPPGIEIGAGNSVDLLTQAPGGVRGGAGSTARDSGARRITLRPASYRGIPLAPGSDVMSVATAAGSLLTVRERNLPAAVDGTTPTVDRDTARRAALDAGRAHAMPADGRVAGDPRQEVFVDGSGRGRLAWRMRVESPSLTRPWARDIWVAAIGTPAVLADRDAILAADSSGHVTATVYAASSLGAVARADLGGAFVTTAAGQATTDDDGRFALAAGSGTPAMVGVDLSGPFSDIVNYAAGGRVTVQQQVTGGGAIELAVNARTPEELAQTSAFLFVNYAHAVVQDFLPPGALARLPTHVNLDETCNAFWNYTSLNFFRAGPGPAGSGRLCANSAYSDVVLHEYGHAVDDAMGGILDAGYSEGFGDALAIIASRQPCAGRDFYGIGTCMRNATDPVTWPTQSTEPHQVGRPYAGFVWDLITALQQGGDPPDTAFETARRLVLAAAAANPANVPDAVRLSFVADDDDGDLSTCSPHFRVLAAAADNRKIPRPADCVERGTPPVAVSAPPAATAPSAVAAPRPSTRPDDPAAAASGASAATGILLAPR